jgi:hypothetical protein
MEINLWKSECESLMRYIKDNDEININKREISIPISLRDEFYRRFDHIRKAMVEELYSTLPVDVEILSTKYKQVEKEIIELLKLESISMPVDLSSFLHSPKEGMVRVLYSRLFDLLQGKTTLEVFEKSARSDFQSGAADLYRLGYEYWAALTLIKLFEPDEAFQVDLDLEYRPYLTELKSISFGRQAHHPTIRIPEFVIHSRKVNKYLAVKMALAREIPNYHAPYTLPVRPKRPTGDTSLAMDSRAMILSVMSSPDEIPIIAETYDRKIESPDLIIEFLTSSELQNPDAIDQVRSHFEILNPKLGICLLSMDCGEKSPELLPEGFFAFGVGFDPSNLHPVTALLA